jgi:ATP-dependent exoDNAse (exonuclease V) alpha subunit
MAIYHLSAQIISRSSGGSAVAAAAYRTGERLHDERTGITHDYSRRRDKIPEVFVMAPGNAPVWVHDQEKLWNAVEAAERRKDAQLSREVNVALPRELQPEEQTRLLREYVRSAFVSCGMVAGVAVHVHDVKNPHAHIMLTTRDIGPEGFGKKNRSWNDREMLESQREQWAEACNRRLSRAGHEIRIDHRSLSAQGIEREPTIHQGVHATAMERRIEQARESGKVLAFPSPDRCVQNREIVERNEKVRGISAQIIDLAEARGRMEEARARGKEAERVRMIQQNHQMEQEPQDDDLARYIAEGVSRMKTRAYQWSVDKKAAAIAKEKALAEERAAKEKALAFEKAAQEAERDRRVEMSAVLEKEANRSAWQGKRPIVEAVVKEYPELAGTAAALEAIARQPGFSSVSFEDRNRLMKAIGKASWLIEKGEPLRGAKDPRVGKIARESAKEYKLENERGMER